MDSPSWQTESNVPDGTKEKPDKAIPASRSGLAVEIGQCDLAGAAAKASGGGAPLVDGVAIHQYVVMLARHHE